MKCSSKAILGALFSSLLAGLANEPNAQPIRTTDYQKRLEMGDLSVLNELKEQHSLDDLYDILSRASRKVLGPHSRAIEEQTRRTISSIPDHASYLADRIEAASQEIRGNRKRENAFSLLSRVRSPEAIQIIGSYFYDQRNPDSAVWTTDMGSPQPSANNLHAYFAMIEALGEDSPVDLTSIHGYTDRNRMLAWWASDASLPYRQPKAAQVAPLQTPTVKKVPTPPPTVVGTTSPPQTTDWLLPLLLFIGGGGLIFWVTRGAHRRS